MAQKYQNYMKRGETYLLEKFQNFRLRKCFPTSKKDFETRY